MYLIYVCMYMYIHTHVYKSFALKYKKPSLYVCMQYVCVACMHASMYVLHACMHALYVCADIISEPVSKRKEHPLHACVCMYVCISCKMQEASSSCMCMYVCMLQYVCMYICVYMYVCMYVYVVYVCMYVCMYV